MDAHTDSRQESPLPQAPVDQIISPIVRFMRIEAASGIVLLAATVTALILANSPLAGSYERFWHTPVALAVGGLEFRQSLQHIINDGLMTIFFFVVGMEVKHELVIGELRSFRRAALPIAAAIGGMVVPAAIYLAIHWSKPAESGWGIAMATDIAFVVGCMAVLGKRVPHGLRVMLLTLAIVDDIGAILVIAVGYSLGLNGSWLAMAAGGLLVVLLLQRLGVRRIGVYLCVGAGIWFAVLESGIHATIAGVILGLMTPARPLVDRELLAGLFRRAQAEIAGHFQAGDSHRISRVSQVRHVARETISPVEYLIHGLHPWVSFIIMPVFALANAGVAFRPGDVGSPIALAVLLALLIGKPVGVVLTSLAAVKAGLSELPTGVTWRRLMGGGCLCGIGFTMALFIAGLALKDDMLGMAKVGILAGSLVSAIVGMAILIVAPAPAPKAHG